MYNRIFNFSAGPSVLPVPVLEKARDEMLNCRGHGMSVMEMSHRSKMYSDIRDSAEASIRRVMNISDDYAVLFLQGGASLQFAMVPMNLYLSDKPVDVIDTGSWTSKAIVEINKIAKSRLVASSKSDKYTRIPTSDEISLNPDASYVHLASNNTIYGTQWHSFIDTGDVPLVVDMSSDILSYEIDVSKFGLIFAGAQKNIGPAGVTLVIIRRDLAERATDNVPTMLKYATHIKKDSMYNTPATFGIYFIDLVMDWIEGEGGISAIAERNKAQAKYLYNAIDESDFYTSPVSSESRSTMNVVFLIQGGNPELEKKFVAEATEANMVNLKGHRSVGGLRASLYNAQPMSAVEALVSFMNDFESKNG
ncbi:MAG: phosphoserine transaminase [Anaerolineaceae bacterium 4572_78]|nr:MAG: phosphoserine transaminase [Anaerolineaceae bacterium 4572_78]